MGFVGRENQWRREGCGKDGSEVGRVVQREDSVEGGKSEEAY